MSTKIFHGWRYRPGGTPDPFRLAAELTENVTPVLRAVCRRRVAAAATKLVDDATFGIGDGDGSDSPLLTAERRIDAAYLKARGSRQRSRDDFTASASILANPLEPESLLVLMFSEQDIAEGFAAVDGLEPYPYWNNSDRPDDVSVEEWAHRAEVWDAALGWDPPAARGLQWEALEVTFVSLSEVDGVDLVLAEVPSRDVRACRIVFEEYVSRIDMDLSPGGSTSGIVAALREAEEAAAVDTQRLAEVEAALVDITRDVLIGARPASTSEVPSAT